MEATIIAVAVVWLACGVATANILAAKGEDRLPGFLLGIILGPLGVFLAVAMKPVDPVVWSKPN